MTQSSFFEGFQDGPAGLMGTLMAMCRRRLRAACALELKVWGRNDPIDLKLYLGRGCFGKAEFGKAEAEHDFWELLMD